MHPDDGVAAFAGAPVIEPALRCEENLAAGGACQGESRASDEGGTAGRCANVTSVKQMTADRDPDHFQTEMFR
jgi:hypothetical protein